MRHAPPRHPGLLSVHLAKWTLSDTSAPSAGQSDRKLTPDGYLGGQVSGGQALRGEVSRSERINFSAESGGNVPNDPFHQELIQAHRIGTVLADGASRIAKMGVTDIGETKETVALMIGERFGTGNLVAAKSGINRSKVTGRITPGTEFNETQRPFLNSIQKKMGSNIFGRFHNATYEHRNHAETKIRTHSQIHGIQPAVLAASRPFCSSCAKSIRASGGFIFGDRIAIWRVN